MEFGIEKCTILVINNGKAETKGIELTNQDIISLLNKNGDCKCLGILKADAIKQEEKKAKTINKEKKQE